MEINQTHSGYLPMRLQCKQTDRIVPGNVSRTSSKMCRYRILKTECVVYLQLGQPTSSSALVANRVYAHGSFCASKANMQMSHMGHFSVNRRTK